MLTLTLKSYPNPNYNPNPTGTPTELYQTVLTLTDIVGHQCGPSDRQTSLNWSSAAENLTVLAVINC